MASNNGDAAVFTTNEEDQREAQKLKDRLRNQTTAASSHNADGNSKRLPSVKIASGRHKYVLIKAEYRLPGQPSTAADGKRNVATSTQYFVTSKRGASYHRNAAEPMIAEIEQAGCYEDIDIVGGGRITLDKDARKISIFGHSYTFGQANHAISRQVILDDERYKGFDVSISNEGY